MKPTVLGDQATAQVVGTPITRSDPSANPLVPADVATTVAASVQLPFTLTSEQLAAAKQNAASYDFVRMPASQISTIGSDADRNLQQMLDGFLALVDKAENPEIFEVFNKLKKGVDEAKLGDLGDKLLKGESDPSFLEQLGRWVSKLSSKKAREEAASKAFQAIVDAVRGKTTSLKDLMHNLEQELGQGIVRLQDQLRVQNELKLAYGDRIGDFTVAAAGAFIFLEQARPIVAAAEEEAKTCTDPIRLGEIQELRNKLQWLESRALALEGTLTGIPGQQLIIQQLENAGIGTLQETVTTAGSRFASIKGTLLALHGGLEARRLQNLNASAKQMDADLDRLRAQVTKGVVTTAATAPGENRVAQAAQIQKIVAENQELQAIVEQARATNAEKFKQARATFKDARTALAKLGDPVEVERLASQRQIEKK